MGQKSAAGVEKDFCGMGLRVGRKYGIICAVLLLRRFFNGEDKRRKREHQMKQKKPQDGENLPIRNSTAQFLIFAKEAGASTISVRFQDEMVWLTLNGIAELFGVDKSVVSRHLGNIYSDKELDEKATVAKYATVQKEGAREVTRQLEYYSLEAIIAVGYRVNSQRATEFRRWATRVLRDFAIRGYVLDRERLENGKFLGEDYFERLIEEIQAIRMSERRFYQKITDIYATAMDYDKNAEETRVFFAKVQNKLHYAVHGQTAAELIWTRADAGKDNMGLITWAKSPNGRILKSDVTIAKNYLTEHELQSLSLIVNAYLDLALRQAQRHIPMTMAAWAKQLDLVIVASGDELLARASEISAEIAEAKAVSEYEKFRVRQELEYKSDFDQQLDLIEEQAKKARGKE